MTRMLRKNIRDKISDLRYHQNETASIREGKPKATVAKIVDNKTECRFTIFTFSPLYGRPTLSFWTDPWLLGNSQVS